jgi:hypothetical protein
LVVRGHRVGERVREGGILEVLGDDGGRSFVVCWGDGGYVSRVFPGSDASVGRFARARSAAPRLSAKLDAEHPEEASR